MGLVDPGVDDGDAHVNRRIDPVDGGNGVVVGAYALDARGDGLRKGIHLLVGYNVLYSSVK
jgi:hypothetical protein